MQEFHPDSLVIDILIEIKNIHLNVTGETVYRWPAAYIGHAFVLIPRYSYRYGKNPIGRDKLIFFFNHDIGRWITQLPANLVTPDYGTSDKENLPNGKSSI